MDIVLRPLIHELNDLWVNGFETRDAASEYNVFRMHVVLARSSLSRWSGQGYRACPTCNEDKPSMQVIIKTAYFGHRCIMATNHH